MSSTARVSFSFRSISVGPGVAHPVAAAVSLYDPGFTGRAMPKRNPAPERSGMVTTTQSPTAG